VRIDKAVSTELRSEIFFAIGLDRREMLETQTLICPSGKSGLVPIRPATRRIRGYSAADRRVGKAKRAHHSLTKRSCNLPHVSAPIGRKPTPFDKPMKAAMRPVRYARYVSMLHGIEVDVVDVAIEICVVANRVFPITTLPDALFALQHLALRPVTSFDSARKPALDKAPAGGEIGIMLRQHP
jgi:hypothetical protein